MVLMRKWEAQAEILSSLLHSLPSGIPCPAGGQVLCPRSNAKQIPATLVQRTLRRGSDCRRRLRSRR